MKLRLFSSYLIISKFLFMLSNALIGTLISITLLFLSIASSYAAPPNLAAPAPYEYGGQFPVDLEVVDINNDGILDVVTSTQSGKVSFLIGDGTGRLLKENSLFLVNGLGDVTVADFNGDGIMDLAVDTGAQDYSSWYGVKIYLGTGGKKALFTLKREYPGFDGPLTTGDFNNDGHVDLALQKYGTNILFGKGDGTFSNLKRIGGSTTARVSVADLNGDGLDDLITDTARYLSNGDGSFVAISGGAGLRVAGDLNGDGLDDTAQINPYASSLEIALSNADGSYSYSSLPDVVVAIDLQIVDMNRDGNADLLVRFVGASDLSFYEGNGDGTFLAAQSVGNFPYFTRLTSQHFITGDWNGDKVAYKRAITATASDNIAVSKVKFFS